MLLSDKLYVKNSQMTKVYDRIEEDSNSAKPKENKTQPPHPLEVLITKYVMLMLPAEEGYTVFV